MNGKGIREGVLSLALCMSILTDYIYNGGINDTKEGMLKYERKECPMSDLRCFECGAKNEYEMKEDTREYKGEGYQFTLNVTLPFCKRCGAPLVDETIEQDIAEKANAEIRKQRGIIKQEEILEILTKYKVSQKNLSRLLGWGEITLTRYISGGYTPNSNNSDKLKSIQDPYVLKRIMYEKSEETDGEIAKESFFERLEQSVNLQIECIERREGKIYQVVNWFLSEATEETPITHLALQNLLYFSQGWNFVFNGECLFPNDCEAWIHGAVYRNIYENFKKFKSAPLPSIKKKVFLSEREKEVLSFAKKYYFDVYTARFMEQICHLEEPYRFTREGYKSNQNSEEIISKEQIQKYYLKIAERYNISVHNQKNVRLYLNDLLQDDFIME